VTGGGGDPKLRLPSSDPAVPEPAVPRPQPVPRRRTELSPEQLAADIAARVRPVVPDMPAAAFDALVRRMADVELKYRDPERAAWHPSIRPAD